MRLHRLHHSLFLVVRFALINMYIYLCSVTTTVLVHHMYWLSYHLSLSKTIVDIYLLCYYEVCMSCQFAIRLLNTRTDPYFVGTETARGVQCTHVR